MIDVIIVDDEQSGVNVLQKLLTDYFPEVIITAVCSNIDAAEKAIRSEKPDILFLDIEMPGGSGFDLLERLGVIPFPVVFVTAYNQYAIRALRLSATDYLLKPVTRHDIAQALEKSKQMLQFRQQHPVNYAAMLANNASRGYDRLLVINKYTQESISFRDIVCVTADSNYAVIHTLQKKQVTVAKPLKELEELLCDESHGFLRIHKSVVINTGYILSSKIQSGVLFIELEHGHRFEVSKRKKTEIEAILRKIDRA